MRHQQLPAELSEALMRTKTQMQRHGVLFSLITANAAFPHHAYMLAGGVFAVIGFCSEVLPPISAVVYVAIVDSKEIVHRQEKLHLSRHNSV